MKKLKAFIFPILSVALFLSLQQRVVLMTLTSASLFALVSQANQYDPKPPEPEKQAENAIQAVNSPSLSMASVTSSSIIGSLTSPGGHNQKKGLQFKDPVLSPGVTYRSFDDTTSGGFGGNELSGDLGIDADIYDGWIAGAIYQHTYREATNDFATSEHLNSDGFSLFAAKRFKDLINAGLAYNFATSDHDLSRAVIANLDRVSNGFTVLAGLSNNKVFWTNNNKWNWSTMASYSYVDDNYEAQRDLTTALFSSSNYLGYDVNKWLTLGANLTYNYFIQQETFSGAPARDDDFITIGPRLRFYPSERATVNLEFNSQEAFTDYRAYVVRLGVDINF